MDSFKKAKKEPTYQNVKNAICECYISATKEIIGKEALEEEDIKGMCLAKIKELCKKNAIDFDHPSKDELKKMIELLKEESKGVRPLPEIEKHYLECLYLIDRIPEK